MRYTLITGASSGMGLEYARQSAAAGENIIIVSNQEQANNAAAEQIAGQYGVDAKVITVDLSKQNAAREVYDTACSYGVVDKLISNAGVLHFGKLSKTTDEYTDFITALHCTTPIKLCRLFSADMAARREGKILITCSMTAWTPYPTMSLYGSTKAALKSFAQSLWYEMREYGVSVTTVFPGAVDTPLYNLSDRHRKWLRALGVMSSAQSVARKGLRAMRRGRRTLIPGVFTKIAVFGCKILPAHAILLVMRIPAIKRLLASL